MKLKNYIASISLILGILWTPDLPAQNDWEQMEPLLHKTSWYGSCMDPAGEKVYIFGGGLDLVQIYDFNTNTWEYGAPMPNAASALSAEMVDGKIYTFGEFFNPISMTTVKEYDPVDSTWSIKGPLPEIFYGQGSCTYEGLIYSFGGRDSNFNRIKTVRSYDPVNDQWEQHDDMPYAKDSPAVCVYQDTIYLFGGDPSLKYDPLNDTWAELNTGTCEILAYAVPIIDDDHDRILLFGGYKEGINYPNPCNEIWAYYPEKDSMVKLNAVMPFDRFTRGYKHNDYVYLFGGHYDDFLVAVTDEVWRACLNCDAINEMNYASRGDIILSPNHPNPFSRSTTIEYRLAVPTTTQITIYNHLGEQVERIEKKQSQGTQLEVWNAEGLPSGVYHCVLRTENGMQTVKMIKL